MFFIFNQADLLGTKNITYKIFIHGRIFYQDSWQKQSRCCVPGQRPARGNHQHGPFPAAFIVVDLWYESKRMQDQVEEQTCSTIQLHSSRPVATCRVSSLRPHSADLNYSPLANRAQTEVGLL